MRTIACRNECGWESLAVTKRGAQLRQDVHNSTCPRREPSIEDTSGQMLMCRHRKFGCMWLVKFHAGGLSEAEAERAAHELVCSYV